MGFKNLRFKLNFNIRITKSGVLVSFFGLPVYLGLLQTRDINNINIIKRNFKIKFKFKNHN